MTRITAFLFLLSTVLLLSSVLPGSLGYDDAERQCTPITIPMCKGIGYNSTSMPNQYNHLTQEEAGMEVHQFWPLVGINCSADLNFFLCSVYTPICIADYPKPLKACRSVCERARKGCSPLMKQYGFEWPESLDCALWPTYGQPDELCMDSNQSDSSSTTSRTSQSPKVKTTKIGSGVFKNSTGRMIPGSGTGHRNQACQCSCSSSPFFRATGTDRPMKVFNVSYCTYECYAPHVGKDRRNFLNFWIGLWSVLCCLATCITVLTFLIDTDRYKYPERPIIFLASCYFMVSVGYLIRIIAGHEAVACEASGAIRSGTNGPAQCTVVFLLVYFFGMASSAWWVVLALTWFLSAGLKWSNEAIANWSQYFHIGAWAAPSTLTVAVLALSAVDGDPYGGVCSVGNTNINMLLAFVTIPLFVCLAVGSLFLVSGFVALIRIHNIVKRQEGLLKIDKLEQLMVRIGIFSVLYTIPAGIVIGCLIYEQLYRNSWEATEVCNEHCQISRSQPAFAVFLLKHFMCLVVGVTSCIWIWNRKTLEAWKRFLCRLLCCRPEPAGGVYAATDAIIVKSHTDISSGYSRHYPLIRHI